MEEAIKNYGIDLEKELMDQDEENDYVGSGDIYYNELLIPNNSSRKQFLPTGEVQKGKRGDMMDCASRAPNNIDESKFNYGFNNFFRIETKDWFVKKKFVNFNSGKVELADAPIASMQHNITDFFIHSPRELKIFYFFPINNLTELRVHL